MEHAPTVLLISNKTLLQKLTAMFLFSLAFDQNCSIPFQAVGCYRDIGHRRTLPHLIMNGRGAIDFWPNYETGLPR